MRRQNFWRVWIALLLPAALASIAAIVLGRLSPASSFTLAAIAILASGAVALWELRRREQRRRLFLGFARDLAAHRLESRLPIRTDIVEDVSIERWNDTAQALEARFRDMEANRVRLAALLNSLQEGVIAVDETGRVIWANPRVEKLTGQRVVLDAALVQSLRDPDVLALVETALRDTTAQRGLARSIVAGRVFDVSTAPMPGGAVAVLHDITDKERMETTRRDFLANVSHELRTPLTSIRGYVETLLQDEKLDDEQRDFLSIILKNAYRMSRLTEDLLALARVESGEHKLQLEEVPAALLLNDAMDSLSGLVDDHGMLLDIAFTSDRPVLADRDAMHQVLSNLIENAAKYAGDGGRILLGAVEKGDAVELFVQDFGPGIRAEHLARIFERFYRVDKARSIETGGTGLGLAIAKHIVLAHGGSIRAESTLNHGATFILTLPAADTLSDSELPEPAATFVSAL